MIAFKVEWEYGVRVWRCRVLGEWGDVLVVSWRGREERVSREGPAHAFVRTEREALVLRNEKIGDRAVVFAVRASRLAETLRSPLEFEDASAPYFVR